MMADRKHTIVIECRRCNEREDVTYQLIGGVWIAGSGVAQCSGCNSERRWTTTRNEAEVRAAFLAALDESKTPIADTYACRRCGRRDGLDTSMDDDAWRLISGREDGGGLLCLWCIDELAAEKGIEHLPVMLHFAGRRAFSIGERTIWDDDGEVREELLRTARQQIAARLALGEIRDITDGDCSDTEAYARVCIRAHEIVLQFEKVFGRITIPGPR